MSPAMDVVIYKRCASLPLWGRKVILEKAKLIKQVSL